MSLLNIPIPNLLNGVSQQPANLRFPTQCEIQENAYSSIVEGMGKRPPTEHLSRIETDQAVSNKKIHGIDRGDNTERYVVILSGSSGGLSVYDIYGVPQTVYWDGDATRRAAAQSYINCSGGNPNVDLRCISIGDYTFIVNINKTVAMSTTLSSSQANEALIWVKQGGNQIKYNITGTINSSYTSLNSTQTATIDGESFTNINPGDATFIAANLNANFGTTTGYTRTRKGYVIHISSTSAFTLDVSDGIAGSGLGLVKDSVQSFSDLPTVAKHGMLIKIAGLPSSSVDDYWVKFIANTGSGVGEGIWQETAGPNIKNDFDYSTMPIVLIRQSNGTFLAKLADGINPPSLSPAGSLPAGADYSNAKWTGRVCGDENTNVTPSFVGSKITDIFLFRGRLGFLSGESVVLTESGEFFNFWKTTVTQVLDSDPIDVSSSYPAVTIFRHAIPFADRLVLFSDKVQFVLSTRQSILSSASVTLTPVANYDVLKNCRPVPVNDGIFFAFDRGNYSGFRQMVVNTSDSEQLTAPDISSHIPKYIPGNVYTIAASSHDNVLAALTASDTSTIYIYKWYDSDSERIQSSWSKWTFHNAKILGCVWMQTSLYVVVWRNFGSSTNGHIYLEKITVEPNRKDSYSQFITALDRRASPTTATYDANTNRTTLQMRFPYGTLGADYQPKVTKKATATSEAGYLIPVISWTDVNTGAGTPETLCNIVVPGNIAVDDVWVGVPYKMRYQFSQPYLKQSDGSKQTTISSGRFQIRNMNVVYDNSANFVVYVTYKFGGASYSYPWSGNILGTGQAIIGDVAVESGSFKIPIYGKNSEIYVTIENLSHFPSNFLSAEIEASYDSRSRRV